jgi:hypothetical protein
VTNPRRRVCRRPSRLGACQPRIFFSFELRHREDVGYILNGGSNRTLPVVGIGLDRDDDAVVVSTKSEHTIR